MACSENLNHSVICCGVTCVEVVPKVVDPIVVFGIFSGHATTKQLSLDDSTAVRTVQVADAVIAALERDRVGLAAIPLS